MDDFLTTMTQHNNNFFFLGGGTLNAMMETYSTVWKGTKEHQEYTTTRNFLSISDDCLKKIWFLQHLVTIIPKSSTFRKKQCYQIWQFGAIWAAFWTIWQSVFWFGNLKIWLLFRLLSKNCYKNLSKLVFNINFKALM